MLSLAIGDKFKREQNEAKKDIEQLNVALRDQHEKVTTLNTQLESKVEEQTRDIKSMLDNISLGIFVIRKDLNVARRYSKQLEEILDTKKIAGIYFADLLFSNIKGNREDVSKTVSVIEGSIGESYLNFEVNQKCLIEEIEIHTKKSKIKSLEISWIPIIDQNEDIDRILVSVKDVTKIKRLEEMSAKKNKDLGFIVELIQIEKEKYRRFVGTTKKLLDENFRLLNTNKNANHEVLKILYINLHTLKGIARSLSFKQLSERLHAIEDHVSAVQNDISKWSFDQIFEDHQSLQELFEYYIYVNDELLQRSADSNVFEFNFDQVADIMEGLRQLDISLLPAKVGGFFEKIDRLFSASFFISGQELFEEIFSSAERLARDLRKPKPRVEINQANFEFTPDAAEVIRNIFVHLIRNSIDHGIEPPSERLESNKTPEGGLTLNFSGTKDGLILEYFDDGRGLAVRTIYELGRIQGYLSDRDSPNDEQLSKMIFQPGFSTSHRTTDISGRGIGMSAIQSYAESIGAVLTLDLDPISSTSQDDLFRSFRIKLCLPKHCYREINEARFKRFVA